MSQQTAIQDQIPNNQCYGCGAENQHGLQIKSYWQSDNEATCDFIPKPHHCAGPTHFLNGGIISTIIDCHCVCMAIAKGYQLNEQSVGQDPAIWFATGNLNVSFIKPVAMASVVTLVAKLVSTSKKKMVIECQLLSKGEVCCKAEVVAVKVPSEWFDGKK